MDKKEIKKNKISILTIVTTALSIIMLILIITIDIYLYVNRDPYGYYVMAFYPITLVGGGYTIILFVLSIIGFFVDKYTTKEIATIKNIFVTLLVLIPILGILYIILKYYT